MMRLFGKTFAPSKTQKGFVNDTNEPHCSFEDSTNLKHNTSTSCELNEKKSLPREEQIKPRKCIPIEGETSISQSQENEEQAEATNSSQEHTLKKPDKIIPCPRCTSMDTKFCYYNNYNVNQPRHFCRKCQRYWTDGGIMRSVPVGSGRRKNNKHTHAPHHPQNLVSNSLEESSRSNDVYSFGSNIPYCESTNQLGFVSDQFSNSDPMGSNTILGTNYHGFLLQVPFYAVPHWPTVRPCNISEACPTHNSPNQSLLSSSPNSQTVGKHSRDEANIINASSNLNSKDDALRSENRLKGGVWVPKTLRFDDPNDASKSSVWATLAINSEKTSYINSRGLFKDFQSKKGVEEKSHCVSTSPMLQANPAAMSRSQNFHETM